MYDIALPSAIQTHVIVQFFPDMLCFLKGLQLQMVGLSLAFTYLLTVYDTVSQYYVHRGGRLYTALIQEYAWISVA